MCRRHMRLLYSIAVSAVLGSCLISLVGCGSSGTDIVPIRGEVTFNGAPLQDGMVVYVPKQTDSARQASGRIQADGTFVLTTFKSGDGVVPGEYNIAVYGYSPRGATLTRQQTESGAAVPQSKLIIPVSYTDPMSSGLSDTVDSDHSGFKRIELAG